jgi:hypothetical protein
MVIAAACGGTVSGGNDGGGGGDGGGSGASCATNGDCESGSYCDRGGSCGTSGTKGTCKSKPQGCSLLYSPTCGCDGKVYGNACAMNGAGVDLNAGGTCPAPQGWIACGDKYCPIDITYCQRTGNDVGGPGQPKEYDSCPMLPASCMGKADCSCFPQTTPCISFKMCKPITNAGQTGFEIWCPGG